MSDDKELLTRRRTGPPLDEAVAGAPIGKAIDATTSSDTVTVACKLPNGLILKTYDMVDGEEKAYGVTHKFKIAKPTGQEVILNGAALNVAAVMNGHYPEHQIVGGYALTHGVPRDFWERWYEDNKTTNLVRNGLVFAMPRASDAMAEARSNAAIKSGLEPLDPENLPSDVRGLQRRAGGSVSGIQTGTTGNDVDNL